MTDKQTQTQSALELIGGPYDGEIHEAMHGFPLPDKLGLVFPKPDGERVWYKNNGDGTATYLQDDAP